MSADEEKKLGNEAFSKKDFKTAIEHFTKAIELAPTNHVLYSNRSAAYAGLGDYDSALKDADKVIEINPSWARGHGRRATALHFLGRYGEAYQEYNTVLRMDPENAQAKEGIREIEPILRRTQQEIMSRIFDGDVIGRLAASPETAEYVKDPAFVETINKIKANPSSLSAFINDERVIKSLGVLMNIAQHGGDDHCGCGDDHCGCGHDHDDEDERRMEVEKEEEEKKRREAEEEAERKRKEAEEEEAKKKIPAEKVAAEEEKALGNAEYKAKNFEGAVAHYRKAMELFPAEATYRSNLAAALLEMKKYDECIAECEGCVDDAKKAGNYALIPKLYTRMGNAYGKQLKWDKAIEYYNKSLTEHRTADTLARLQKAEKAKKEADEKAYIDPAISQQEKERGNEFFKKGMHPEAIKAYTEAIRRNPGDHLLYSNRAASYMKLGEFPTAIRDCDKCISLAPNFVKGYTRKGACHYFMKEYHKAIEAYDKGLKVDPENQECKEGLAKIEATINANQHSDEMDPEQVKHAMADPEIRAILEDPMMNKILQDMSTDPMAANKYLQDPSICSKLEKLIAAGVLKMSPKY